MRRFYYFGCRGSAVGHFLHASGTFPVTDPEIDAPDGAVVDGYVRVGDRWHGISAGARQNSSRREHLEGGFPVYLLDGTFAPLSPNDRTWRLTQLRFCGHIVSILAKHDNTIDKRPGSNACFVSVDHAPWTEEQILAEAKASFPDCWKRLEAARHGVFLDVATVGPPATPPAKVTP